MVKEHGVAGTGSRQDEAADLETPRWRAAMSAGEAAQFTVDELLGELHGALTRRQLTSWGSYGLLPTPERRVPPGAPDRVARALYPWWTVHVIFELLQERAGGTKLTELQATAQERIERWRNHPLVNPDVARAMAFQAPPAIPRGLQRAAWEYAELYARAHRQTLARGITIVLHDGAGNQEAVLINPPPTEAQERATP